MIKNRTAVTISSFVSMFFLGVGATIVGAAATNIGLSAFQIGLLLTVQNVGFMLAVTLSGAVGDTYEKPRILLFGSLVTAASYAVFYRWEPFLLNLLVMFFIGGGTGTYEGVNDAMLLDIHDERQNFYITVNHFFVTFGSLMITLYLVFLQMNWRLSLTQSAIAVLLLAVFFSMTRVAKKEGHVDPLSKRVNFLLHQPVVGVLFVTTICSVSLEYCATGFITTYLMNLRGFTHVTSKLGLVIFIVGIAVGRLLVGFFTKEHWIFTNILILFGLATVFSALLYFIDWGIAVYAILFVTGLTVSSTLPLVITFAGLAYKEMSGTVLGIIKIGIAIGGILIPFLFSLLAKYLSLQAAYAIYPATGGACFFLLMLNRKRFSQVALYGVPLTGERNG
jgi:predicted MFS family arabinose efflux permease